MNKLILIIALVILLGGGAFLLKRKSSNQQPMNIPPISPSTYSSSWQPPGMQNTLPTGYQQMGGQMPTQNPSMLQSFLGTAPAKKPCGCGH